MCMYMKFRPIAGLLLFLAACSSPEGDGGIGPKAEQELADVLHIDFQTGFFQDTIVLYHGREKVYESILTSDEDTALTDKFVMPISELRDTLYFKVAQQGRVLKGHIPPNADRYIGFYLTSGTAVNIYSKDTPFEYNAQPGQN